MKNNISSVLSPDEKIIEEIKPHLGRLSITSKPFMLFILGIILSIVLFFYKVPYSKLAILCFFLLSLIAFSSKLFIYKITNIVVTNKKVIIEDGFFGKDYSIIKFDKIIDLKIDVTPIDHLFGTGDIRFITADDNDFRLSHIKNPKKFIKYTNF